MAHDEKRKVGEIRNQAPNLPATPDSTQSSVTSPAVTAEAAEVPGALSATSGGARTYIGRYKLLQQIGEGGMGVVFMAEQDEPVRRRVALKIIKPGMDSAAVIARFEAERQALAMMEHPNIAHVFDAGTTTTGRPYFVMELVQGTTITRYCDDKHLTLRDRLALFRVVCSAVQHAHQKGIIHRDLKPSNILVTVADGEPVPKIIDFGVAKALHQRLTDKTLFTQFGNVIGTLEYMSPEQADLDIKGTDTRSDIYSLGVVLYELLTGTTPLDGAMLREAAYAQVLRTIREQEPPRPSTRLVSSAESLASVSALRGTEPRRLTRLVSGDLDWIVMKCLEKDRARRYETANGLARDIERYLSDEPVDASPPSAVYKLRKLARKYKATVTALAAIALALILGIIGTSIGLTRARWSAKTESQEKLKAQAAERRALDSEAAALRQEKAAQIESGQRLVSEADALQLADRSGDAVQRYTQARTLLQGLGQSTFRADLGLWRTTDTVQLLNDFSDANTDVLASALLPDGRSAITGGEDGFLRSWDLITGRELLSLPGHGGPIESVAIAPNAMDAVSGSREGLLEVWDLLHGTSRKTMRGHQGAIHAVAILPDGITAVSGGEDGTIRVWDMQSGEETRRIVNPDAHGDKRASIVYCIAVPKDGHTIVTGSIDWHVKRWDTTTGQQLAAFEVKAGGHGNPISALALSPDGSKIVAGEGSIGSGIFVVKPDGTSAGAQLIGHRSAVASIAFGPNPWSVLSSSRDKTLRLWNLSAAKSESVGDQAGWLSAAQFTPDGRMALSAGEQMRLWRLGAGPGFKIWVGDDIWISGISFSADGKLAASGGDGRVGSVADPGPTSVRVWDVATGRTLRVLRGHGGPVWGTAFVAEASELLTCSQDSTVKLWDLRTGKLVRTFNGHVGPVRAVAYCGSLRFVTVGDDRTVRYWQLDQEQPLATLNGHSAPVLSVTAAPAAGRFASSDAEGVIGLWNAADLQNPRWIRAWPGKAAPAVALAPDGNRVAAGSSDGTVSMWDVPSSRMIRSLHAHGGGVSSLVFWADGSKFVSAGNDRCIAIWDTADGSEIHRFTSTEANCVAVSNDGGTLLSGGFARVLHRYDLSLPAVYLQLLPQVAKARATLRNHPDDADALRVLGNWYAAKGVDDWAVELLERSRALGSKRSALTLARAYLMQDNDGSALKAFQVALDRKEAPESYLGLCIQSLNDPGMRSEAARKRMISRNFQVAASDFAELVKADPTDHWNWIYGGCLLAYLNENDAWQEHCVQMLERFGASKEPAIVDRTLKLALLVPDGKYPSALVATYDDLAKAKGPGFIFRWYALVKGMAAYRAGDFNGCIQWMQQAKAAVGPQGFPQLQSPADSFIAMAHFRLGDEAAALESLTRAGQMLLKVGLSATTPENFFVAQVIYREAYGLVVGANSNGS